MSMRHHVSQMKRSLSTTIASLATSISTRRNNSSTRCNNSLASTNSISSSVRTSASLIPEMAMANLIVHNQRHRLICTTRMYGAQMLPSLPHPNRLHSSHLSHQPRILSSSRLAQLLPCLLLKWRRRPLHIPSSGRLFLVAETL